MSSRDVCTRIETLTSGMMSFWCESSGWAPPEAAELLSKSMLHWQTSLASSLRHWLSCTSDGDLILAWANLGALTEGQLKLFLGVWYLDYKADADAIFKKGKLQDPDGCMLDELRKFFVRRIWDVGVDWNPYVELVQQRRNAIHAFRARPVGDFGEWEKELRRHLSFVRYINGGLPYPDEIYEPREF